MKKAWRHLCTITRHRHLVLRYCFRLGLYRQGLAHDLSKYAPVEFRTGVCYYQGDRSPNEAERIERGYSAAWLHHKGRNPHHPEYWVDNSLQPGSFFTCVRMPERYVVEMFCDRLAACRVYLKERFTLSAPYDYYIRSKAHCPIHPESAALLESLLLYLKEHGEAKTFQYIRSNVLYKR